MSLTLYYHPLASFCHKVLIALYENGTAFEKRIIDLGKDADRAELQALWPLSKFPVIRDNYLQGSMQQLVADRMGGARSFSMADGTASPALLRRGNR